MLALKSTFISIYAICKLPFNNVKNNYVNLLLQPILLLLTILLIIIIGLLTFPFVCYHYFLSVYLKFKHGEALVKMLDYLSVLFLLPGKKYGTIRTLFIVESNDMKNMEFELKNKCKSMIENIPEYSSVVRKCSGYYYLLKREYNINEAFLTVTLDNELTQLTQEKLSQYLEENLLDEECLFRMIFFKNPLKDNKYVILLLIHHCITDGFGLWGVVYNYLFDKKIMENLGKSLEKKEVKKLLNLNDIYLETDAFQFLFNEPNPKGDKPYFGIFIEEEVSCIPKLSALRKKFNCTFNEILIAVVMYTLCGRITKSKKEHPKKLGFAFPRHINEDIRQHYENQFFPVNVNNNTQLMVCWTENLITYYNFEDFVGYIHKLYERTNNSVMHELYYSSFCVYNFLPDVVWRKFALVQLSLPVSFFSNSGFVKQQTICRKSVVGCSIGINFCSGSIYLGYLSCDDRLQLTMVAQESYMNSREEVQAILDECVANIHDLYEKMKIKMM